MRCYEGFRSTGEDGPGVVLEIAACVLTQLKRSEETATGAVAYPGTHGHDNASLGRHAWPVRTGGEEDMGKWPPQRAVRHSAFE